MRLAERSPELNASVRCHQEQVLDPSPSPRREVHTRLQRDHHAGLKRRLVGGNDMGILERGQPDRVATVMRELAVGELARDPICYRSEHSGTRVSRAEL